MTTIQETIDRLRELDQKASPAPWAAQGGFVPSGQVSLDIINAEQSFPLMSLWADMAKGEREVNPQDDFALIIETRNALPSLLSEIERLSTNLSIANARLGRVASNHPDAYLDSL